MKIKTTISTALLLLLSLNVNAFDTSTIESFFDDVKNTSVQFYKDNEEEIDEITSKTAELYETGKEKTTKFISKQEVRYQEYQAKQLDIKLVDNKFHTSEDKIPAGCFYNLAVELNGDDLVRSIYLNRGYLRGCINAIDYSVIKKTGKYEYDINACRTHEWPYKNCNKFSIRFKNFDYRIDGVVKQVLGVEKIGNL